MPVVYALPAQAAPGDGSVTVRVVREVNGNGSWDSALEPGMSGVTVNLTDDAGATISGVTAADGRVTLSPAATALTGGKYRVQVINPKPGILYSAFAAREGLAQAPNRLSSTEEFVDLSGGKTVAYTTALWNPGDYCQKNATLVTACIRKDIPPADDVNSRTLVSFPYNARGVDNQTTQVATKGQTGSVYGIGWSKQKKWIFSGAHAHRGSAYGPSGQGAIYVTDRATNATTLFTTVPNAGTTAHAMATNMDLAFTPIVAKEALGDVEVSEDGKDLYTVNLFDRKLYRYDATQKSAAAPKAVYDIPQPDTACPSAGDWRPYGIGIQDGVVYIGGVCSGESTQNRADLRAVVRTFAPVAGAFGAVILDEKLDFPRKASFVGTPCPGAGWFPWSDTIPLKVNGITCHPALSANPEPILADIIVDTDGSLILGFRDRWADQVGQGQSFDPARPGLLTSPASGGALSRACPGAGGMFVMNENLGCGETTRGDGFYQQDRAGLHQNALYAGVALSKVEDTIATSSVDPVDNVFVGGTAFTNRTGTRPTPPVNGGNQLTSTFGKGGSMADLEVLCDEAPLQIGNRVWYDVDKDGIQDPGEKPVVGATVNLYNEAGTVVGTMKTTARGEYYFDDSNVTGGLKPNTKYTIKIDNPADYADPAILLNWVVTQNDAGTNDFIDSDGKVPPGGRFPELAITTGGAGQNNHTYDFGYHQAEGKVSVVKKDSAGNPLPGAVFQLWKETNGTAGLQTTGATPDTKVGATCTTTATGVCEATVVLGSYYWEETQAPANYLLPTPAVFGPLVLTMTNYVQGVSVTAVNQLATGAVSVLKNDQNGKPLAGATFQLWRETNGTAGLQVDGATPDTTVGGTCVTPASGTCSSTVPLGTYYWQETQAPTGYLLPDPAIFGPLTLTMGNRVQGVTTTAVNVQATGTVSILKNDQNGKALAGAVFQLWKESNGTAGLQTTGATPDTVIGTPCTTPATGTCTATVPLGSYYWQETQAPPGYLLPAPAIFGPLDLTMANRTQGVTTTAVNELATGAVNVQKNDQAGKALAGATFQLWRESNSTTGLQIDGATPDTKVGAPCVTPATGTCAATVPLGTYYWQETQAPDGHLLPDPAIFGPLDLTMANRTQGVTATAVNVLATGDVTVVKKDKDGKVLAGAVFQLWKETNGTAGLQLTGGTPDTATGTPCTTGATGICTATVPLGIYYWQETQAPTGYLLPDPAIFGPLELTMANRTQGVTVTAVDELATGAVSILKKNAEGAALSGAVFQLWHETNGTDGLQVDGATPDTKVGATCTTPASGTCTTTVPLGTYYWQETQAPTGYLLPDPAVFGPLTLTMGNRIQGVTTEAVNILATGMVSVLKQDKANKALAGAVFQLWKETNGTAGLQMTGSPADTQVGAPCTTPATGICSTTVPLGTYYWQETQAPDGYLLPDPAIFGPLDLTMANRVQGVTTTALNELATGAVRVLKTDPDGKALAGAEFQLWKETNGTVGLQVDGATPDTKVGVVCTTGATGICTATVPLGSYYWQETKAPDAYDLPMPAIFGPLELTMANRLQGLQVTAVDQLTKGDVTVVKHDQAGKALAGAVFQLWHESNNAAGLQVDGATPDTKVGAACTTPVAGTCTVKVVLGTYYWQEIQAPPGYLLPSPAVFGPLVLTTDNHTAGVTATAVDAPAPGAVTVVKHDQDGKVLAGAVFQLWKDSNGTAGLQVDGATPDTKVGATCTTPASGTCSQVVPLGTYYWQETQAPTRYRLPDPAVFGPLTLTVDNSTKGVTATAVNLPQTSGIRLLKKSTGDNVALAGAVFRLWRESNGIPGLQTDGDTLIPTACTTDVKGQCEFTTLQLGAYYLEETVAPVGYELPAVRISGPHEVDGVVDGPLLEVIRTNNRPPVPPVPPLPVTGQSAPLPAMVAVGLLLLCGGIGALISGRRRRRAG